MDARLHALEIFDAAVKAVQPSHLMARHLSADPSALMICGQRISRSSFRYLYVIGAGKAAASMAMAAENILGDHIHAGLVVTKYGHSLPLKRIKILEAAHPVPDENSVKGVEQTLQLLKELSPDDIVICLISGGASALWCDLPPGISLHDMQSTVNALVRSGADIHAINTVRKHLSMIKGGQLVRHCKAARIFTLMISDVPGDDPNIIGSGPTTGDPGSFSDAIRILRRHGTLDTLPVPVRVHLEAGASGKIEENPRPGDPVFNHTVQEVIGSNALALQAASEKARALGYHTEICPALIAGETEAEAKKLVRFAMDYRGGLPFCYLQGGETTVRVSGTGKGGRNQHFALAALHGMQQLRITEKNPRRVLIMSAGTDGTDGPTDAAGAWADADTLTRAAEKDLSVETYLKNHDAWHFFGQTGNLVHTGPTQTNVMDVMMAIIT